MNAKIFYRMPALIGLALLSWVGFGMADATTSDSKNVVVIGGQPNHYVPLSDVTTLQKQLKDDQDLVQKGKFDQAAMLQNNAHGAKVLTSNADSSSGSSTGSPAVCYASEVQCNFNSFGFCGGTCLVAHWDGFCGCGGCSDRPDGLAGNVCCDHGVATFNNPFAGACPTPSSSSTTATTGMIPSYVGSYDQGVIDGIHWFQMYFVMPSSYTCSTYPYGIPGNHEVVSLTPTDSGLVQTNYGGQAPGSPNECQVNVGAPVNSGKQTLRFNYQEWTNCTHDGKCTDGAFKDTFKSGTVDVTF